MKSHIESAQKFISQLTCYLFLFAERKGIVVRKLIESDWLAPEEALHVICRPLRFPYSIEMRIGHGDKFDESKLKSLLLYRTTRRESFCGDRHFGPKTFLVSLVFSAKAHYSHTFGD